MNDKIKPNKRYSKHYYKVISDIYRNIIKSENLKDALTTLVNITTCEVGCERGSVFINDELTSELYSYIAMGNLEKEIRILNDEGLIGESFSQDKAIIVQKAYQDDRHNRSIDELTGFKTRSVMCVPLKDINHNVIGVIEMLNKFDDNFTQADVKLLQALTEQASLAIQNKLRIESIENEHQKELEFLSAISGISSELKLTPLLEKIILTLTNALDSERATLFINDRKTNELYTEASIGLEKQEIRFPNHLGIAGEVFQSGEVINIAHAYADLRFNPEFDKSTGFFTRSILAAPVRNKANTIIGVTQVLNKKRGIFGQNDISQLLAINSQISLAIENATLFDDVQNIKNYNESILESMTNSVITINEEGLIVTCNNSCVRVLELKDPDDILHKSAYQYFNNINRTLAEKIVEINKSRSDSAQEVLMNIELKLNNKTITSNTTIRPLQDINKERLGTMLVIEDISKEKRMKATMSRYMSPDLAEQLLKSKENSLGGTSKVVTVLFSDIRNFTSMTEEIGPEKTVKMLNEYFTLMVDAIQNRGGILDKFIGDAIMAVFGNPIVSEDDPDRAVQTAIDMMKALQLFNKQRLANKLPAIDHGIGINTGRVLSGNIGSEKRMDFTVIGDGVNIASRVEGLCKEYGVNILITETTFNAVKSTYCTRELDKVIVKGKSKPILIYEIMDHYDEHAFPNQVDLLKHFANGIECYRQGLWKKAIKAFQQSLACAPQDKPSQIYLERCQRLSASPPSGDWDGIRIMSH